jgi:Tol biopolymer transport system component
MRRAGAIVGVVAVLSLVGSSAVSTANNQAAGLSGHLLFTRTHGHDVQAIFLLSGKQERRLTAPGSYCCLLRISPDHTKMLVMPGGDIPLPVTGGTLSLSGSGFKRLRLVDPTLNLVPQAWSPDGKRIAFEGWDDSKPSRTGVYTASSTDGRGLRRMTTRPGLHHDIPLDYSPDGKWLVLYRSVGVDPDPSVGGSLWVVRTNGSGQHRIAGAAARPDPWARWSKTGDRILFANERLAPSGAIWTVRPDGSNLHRVFADKKGRFPIHPVWSPDGKNILFALDPTNDQFTHPTNALWQTRADGSHPQLVLGGANFNRQIEGWR